MEDGQRRHRARGAVGGVSGEVRSRRGDESVSVLQSWAIHCECARAAIGDRALSIASVRGARRPHRHARHTATHHAIAIRERSHRRIISTDSSARRSCSTFSAGAIQSGHRCLDERSRAWTVADGSRANRFGWSPAPLERDGEPQSVSPRVPSRASRREDGCRHRTKRGCSEPSCWRGVAVSAAVTARSLQHP